MVYSWKGKACSRHSKATPGVEYGTGHGHQRDKEQARKSETQGVNSRLIFIRIVLETKKDTNPDLVMAYIAKHTPFMPEAGPRFQRQRRGGLSPRPTPGIRGEGVAVFPIHTVATPRHMMQQGEFALLRPPGIVASSHF